MASVLTYWQMSEDEEAFFDFLERHSNVLALPARMVRDKAEFVPMPLREFVVKYNPTQLTIGLEYFVRAIIPECVPRQDGIWYSVSTMRWCLMDYRRGVIRDNQELSQSNLSCYSAYPSDDSKSYVQKHDDFKKWAKNVFNFGRKMTPAKIELNGYLYRATARAKAAVDAHQVNVGF